MVAFGLVIVVGLLECMIVMRVLMKCIVDGVLCYYF